MSKIDIEKIINGTPQKVLLNAYEKMKENYSRESAEEYASTYMNQPLSFIIENSEHIFTEPYFGLSFYESIICNPCTCAFSVLDSELNKVNAYISEHSNMPEAQMELYKNLCDSMKSVMEHTLNTRIYSDYIKENISEDFEMTLSNLLYDVKCERVSSDNVVELFENCSPIVYLTYAPYVNSTIHSIELMNKLNTIVESFSFCKDDTVETWKTFVENCLCSTKLASDSCYTETYKDIDNRDCRDIMKFIGNINIREAADNFVQPTVTVKVSDVVSTEACNAVNCLFDDIDENILFSEYASNEPFKVDVAAGIFVEAMLDVFMSEYHIVNDTEKDLVSKYPTDFSESCTVEDAYNHLMLEYVTYYPECMTESDDITDDEIDNIDKDDDNKEVDGKKINAPKPKNLATKVQNSFMDREAQQFKNRAIRKQKGQEVGNAFKAAAALPMNVINDIKMQIHKLDEKDDERRKNYMTEPGFRKKAFRNLKLAILYGSMASVNLSLVPVTMLCRHFSKQKDIRIRNELVRELDTQIAVTEEKINDASAEGDKKEKYKLMRIRDQLKAEVARVRMNSKYV